ncbi:MAG TPA: ATPase, T2SS/T4P/T4SS family, partial [Polyangiaceae bacterium]|nr:ATPase, T2SS/T4P/T4SS family [Polyangiaceae bacterium]
DFWRAALVAGTRLQPACLCVVWGRIPNRTGGKNHLIRNHIFRLKISRKESWHMQVEIVIRSDRNEIRRVMSAESNLLTFGRNPESSVQLEGDSVSRMHARVLVSSDCLVVEDTSTNGTWANGRVLKRSATNVPFGALLKMGEYTIAIAPPRSPALTAAVEAAMLPSLAGAAVADQPTPIANPIAEPDTSATPPQTPENPLTAAEQAAARAADIELRREVHQRLLANLDLGSLDPSKAEDPSLRPKVLAALRKVVQDLDARIPPAIDRDTLIGELSDEALGLGPLERFLADPSVSEIMVVDPDTIFVERKGRLERAEARFTDDERVRAVVERIVTPLGRRIDESSPLVDARLRDGSRVNAVIRPLALRGTCITIRKFTKTPLSLTTLVEYGALTPAMGQFLSRAVMAKKNVVIAGGTGSGKTTLLNVLSERIPEGERIVTIEDAAELRLKQSHVVSLETRPANMEGRGEYTIRDLVKNALRMRPDRIVVGECRGGEALDMLQAMNTGHDGSLTTTHANSPREAISRLETLCLMAGLDLPVRAIREQIAGAIHLVIQQTRLSDGSRKVTQICEVVGIGDEGEVRLVPIFEFMRTGTGANGQVKGEFRSTGFLPSFLNDFVVMGLVRTGEDYL